MLLLSQEKLAFEMETIVGSSLESSWTPMADFAGISQGFTSEEDKRNERKRPRHYSSLTPVNTSERVHNLAACPGSTA